MSTASALAKLKVMLSRSAAFWALCGVASAPAALAKIFIDVASAAAIPRTDGQLDTGYALVSAVDDDERADAVAGGGATVFDFGGVLTLELVAPRTGAEDGEAAELAAFRAAIDTIRAEVLAESGTDGALVLGGISKSTGPYGEPEESVADLGYFHFVDFSVRWGTG